MKNRFDKTGILLWLFILFILGIFYYLYNLDTHLRKYDEYRSSINKLEILNKEFDNFLLEKSNFINYDDINKKIKEFQRNIDMLNSEKSKEYFNKAYSIYLKEVCTAFDEKVDNIEHFKSINSQLVDSFHYLYDLNYAISKSKSINKDKIKLINEIYLNIIKYYINNTIDTTNIEIYLTQLKKYCLLQLP